MNLKTISDYEVVFVFLSVLYFQENYGIINKNIMKGNVLNEKGL